GLTVRQWRRSQGTNQKPYASRPHNVPASNDSFRRWRPPRPTATQYLDCFLRDPSVQGAEVSITSMAYCCRNEEPDRRAVGNSTGRISTLGLPSEPSTDRR